MTRHEVVRTGTWLRDEERVLATLREFGPLTRTTLGERVGLSRTTLSEVTADLLARGALVAMKDRPDARRVGRGRPAVRIALQPSVGQAMGIDLGHRRARIVIVNASHEVIASGRADFAESSDWRGRLEATLAVVDELAASTGVGLGALSGIGIGLPGPLGPDEFGESPHSERIDFISAVLAERFATSVLFDSNTRFAALGEAIYGTGQAVDDLIYMRLGDGIGGGVVSAGRLVRGATGLAGEVGHINVSRLGAPCRCGRRGCLETVASLPAIVAAAARRSASVHDLASLRAAAEEAEAGVASVLAEAGAAVGSVMAAVANAINPSVVVVGGDPVLASAAFLDAARSEFLQLVMPGMETIPFRFASTGDEAGALGAIAAVFHHSPLLAGYHATPVGEAGRA